MTRHALIASSALAVLLTGCASVSPDGLRSEVAQHVASRLPTGTALPLRPVLATHADASASADAAPASAAPTPIDTWLAQPLDADTAVRIAVLNNPSVHVQLAQLVAQDAARAQALTLINPSLTLGRFTRAGEREIEREIGFKLVSLITWPWRARWQGWQLEQHTLNTAQAVLRQAAQARRDWLNAVAARQSLKAAEHLHQAAAAGGELSRRMAAVGNFSQQQHARELQSQQAAAAQLARARLAAQLAHEALARTLGLWGAQAAALTLPEQLPALPKADQLMAGEAAEATALRERLDLRALRRDLDATAERSGVARVGALLGDIGLSHSHNSSQDRATGGSTHTRGWELNLPLPVFDWGAASASARAELDRSAAQLRETALAARSEARSSWLRYRTAWDLAQQQRTEVLPTAQLLQDEAVLRYNGMFIMRVGLAGPSPRHHTSRDHGHRGRARLLAGRGRSATGDAGHLAQLGPAGQPDRDAWHAAWQSAGFVQYHPTPAESTAKKRAYII
jgi:outer membrane protein TolC